MTPGETERLARSGATPACARSPKPISATACSRPSAFLQHGGRFGVGSDSNVAISAAAELRLLEYGQRLHSRARNVLAAGEGSSTGRSLFDAALAGGAAALGQGLPRLAARRAGRLRLPDPGLAGGAGDRILDGWIFADGAVDAVWVGGEQLVSAGRHRDRAAVQARAGQALRRLLQ